LPKAFGEVRVVYSEFKGNLSYGEPHMAGPSKVGPDKWGNKEILRAHYTDKHIFRDIDMHGDSQIIFEIQAPNKNEFAGLGWTWLKLFNGQPLELNEGRWHLPIYTGATRPDLTYLGGSELDKAPGVSLCVKLGNPGDDLTL